MLVSVAVSQKERLASIRRGTHRSRPAGYLPVPRKSQVCFEAFPSLEPSVPRRGDTRSFVNPSLGRPPPIDRGSLSIRPPKLVARTGNGHRSFHLAPYCLKDSGGYGGRVEEKHGSPQRASSPPSSSCISGSREERDGERAREKMRDRDRQKEKNRKTERDRDKRVFPM